MAHQDGIEITPPELRFRFQLGKQMLSTIHVANNGEQRIAYKIKTTAPKKYVVRPSSGIADAHSSVSVQVIMQAQKEQPLDLNCKDKFMVQTVVLAEGEDIDKDTFNKDVRKEGLREARLRVVLEGPAAPPSPVPEASEHDEDSRSIATTGVGAAAVSAPPKTVVEHAVVPEASTGQQETSMLRARLDRITAERDELRRSLEQLQAQQRSAPATRAVAPRRGFTIMHIIIVAILAFLLGHFT